MPTIYRPKKKRKKEYNKHVEVSPAKYYNSIQWRNLRNSYISQNPLCEDCLAKGITKPATEVHHIEPFLRGITDIDRWRLLTDVDNLVSVCKDCHTARHIKLGSFRRYHDRP